MIHIIPLDDLEPHEESTTCKCEPRIIAEPDSDMIIVHNSYDGREGIEIVNEILKTIK